MNFESLTVLRTTRMGGGLALIFGGPYPPVPLSLRPWPHGLHCSTLNN